MMQNNEQVRKALHNLLNTLAPLSIDDARVNQARNNARAALAAPSPTVESAAPAQCELSDALPELPKPWQDRMGEHYAKGNVLCHPTDYFMGQEIADWRAYGLLCRQQCELSDAEILAALASITHEVPSRLPPGWLKFARAIESRIRGQQGRSDAADAVPDDLRRIGELIRTQDNRITDQPMFIVQQKRTYVTDPDYNDSRIEWRRDHLNDYASVTPKRAERLEAAFDISGDVPTGYQRFALFDVWEFVTACFTEQGCKDFLHREGHNLKETRIYAIGTYRNHEFQAVRNWLKSTKLAAIQAQASEGGAS